MKLVFTFITLLLSASTGYAQVKGKPIGFARGTTGGGTATPAAPADIAQLKTWLSDSTPRVILIDKTFDFTNSEGSTTGNVCRDSRTSACPGGTGLGQNWILDTCTTGTWVTGTYENAGRSGLKVASNKSIVGVGSKGIIKGKGLSLTGGVSNIIIQNVHITDLNPEYVWGGDLITLSGCDNVWIDHCKFSLAGRQFIVSGWDAAGRVTITNNEFDGRTNWSAACNNQHYWNMLLIGLKDYYTFVGNWIHDASGRSPHVGTTATASRILFHAYNNLWENSKGHGWDIDGGTYVLIEANQYTNWLTPMTADSSTKGGKVYTVASSSNTGTCSSALGRNCIQNAFSGSGSWPALAHTEVLTALTPWAPYLGTPAPVSGVSASVKANAGIGKI